MHREFVQFQYNMDGAHDCLVSVYTLHKYISLLV